MAADGRAGRRSGWWPEIDGLRGVAVLAVVLYHVFPGALPGGFVGVDIFFVISGYLITDHLRRHFVRGRRALRDFYSRRLCRVLPALLCVLVAILPAGWISLLPVEFAGLGSDVAGAAFSVSNILSWREQGYFDRAAALKPLLHLWSLGVEEQFYLLWPPLMRLASRGNIRLPVLLGATAAVSAGLGGLAAVLDPAAGFYTPLPRVWEFMSGAALTTVPFRESGFLSEQQRNLLSWPIMGGLGLVFALAAPSPLFPTPLALFPVCLTALLLVIGAQASVARRFLCMGWLRWFGAISYPLYLWHWPLVSWHHIVFGVGTLRNKAGIFILVLSILLAWLTTRLVEAYFRKEQRRHAKALCLLIGTCAVGLAGLFVEDRQGWPDRYHESTARLDVAGLNLAVRQGIFVTTPHMDVTRENGITIAAIGNAGSVIVMTGDSLLLQWGARVEQLLVENRLKHRVVFIAGAACSPFAGKAYLPEFAFCRSMQNIQRQIIGKYHAKTVVIGTSWQGLLAGDGPAQAGMKEDFTRQIEGLSDYGVRDVWLVLPTPSDSGFDPARLVRRDFLTVRVNEAAVRTGVPIADLRRDAATVTDLVNAIAAGSGAHVLDAWTDICGAGPNCAVLDETGAPKYADRDHLRPQFVKNHAHFLDGLLTED